MALRKQSFSPGEYYHLYNRGTDKRTIFLDKEDYEYFLYLMYVCNTEQSIEIRRLSNNFDRGESIVDIGAYCLMPNHFHILILEKIKSGISKYMRKIMTAYSMYFNKKYKRTGKLYEGVFKATHADSDQYLKYLYSYIHLNPAKLADKNWRNNNGRDVKKLLDYACTYPYSSFIEYIHDEAQITNSSKFPKYFKNPNDYRKELFEWLDQS